MYGLVDGKRTGTFDISRFSKYTRGIGKEKACNITYSQCSVGEWIRSFDTAKKR
ncbi:hypothetical protein ASZ90_016775 [hydrocarbon metagenome]|uniref:Uncharacterized protein n=1 Tax=hydrocarbon metagenome TaxID=938273 RepID=A0A0W8EAZ6_9ZZZZ